MSASGKLDTYIDLLTKSVNFSTGRINNLPMFIKVVDFLESYNKNSDELMQKTEILAKINDIRKNVEDKALAKRLKKLVRSWFEEQQRRQTAANNKSGLVNGDRTAVPRPTESSTHRNKVHSNEHHIPKSAQVTAGQTPLLVSIPLNLVRLQNYTHSHSHIEPIVAPSHSRVFEKAPHQKNNYITSQTHKFPNERLPQAEVDQTAEVRSHLPPDLPEVPSNSHGHTQIRQREIPSPLGATPPRPPSPFPHKSEEGVTTQDGVFHGWEVPVVIQDSTLVISPYSSLIEWEGQLSIPPTL